MADYPYDVIVVGSGPAGSTASTLLAQHNHKVLMIDRDHHPRFHIGESLLPMSEPVFQRLGIEWVKGEYLPKYGAEFIDEYKDKQARFPLAGAYQPYHVDRSRFDLMMLENAAKHGVAVNQGERVEKIEIDQSCVEIFSDKSHYRARYVIDASGRSALMGRKHRAIDRIKNFGQFALYAHYKNACSDSAKALYQSGDIKILMVDIGWIWIIPLVDNRLSVGLVVKSSASTILKGVDLFNHYINRSRVLSQMLEGADQYNPVRAEAEFSFYNTKRYGMRFACCGDAAGFLDPVFSSGVFLAVTSAQRVADRVSRALIEHQEADSQLHKSDDAEYLLGFNSMLLFVDRFYQHDLVERFLFEADRSEDIKTDIMGLLAGDLWSGGNTFQNKLLSSRKNQRLTV